MQAGRGSLHQIWPDGGRQTQAHKARRVFASACCDGFDLVRVLEHAPRNLDDLCAEGVRITRLGDRSTSGFRAAPPML